MKETRIEKLSKLLENSKVEALGTVEDLCNIKKEQRIDASCFLRIANNANEVMWIVDLPPGQIEDANVAGISKCSPTWWGNSRCSTSR
jgi:hypothetical protein